MPDFLRKLVDAGNFLSSVIAFCYPEVVKLYEGRTQKRSDNARQPELTALHYVIAYLEDFILTHMEDFLNSRHIPVVAVLFDGLFISGDSINASEHDRANPAQNDLANKHIRELLSDMEQYIQEKTGLALFYIIVLILVQRN